MLTDIHHVTLLSAVIDGDEIVYRDYVDISIAVATPKGLVVPVLRNADQLGFAKIEKVCAVCVCGINPLGLERGLLRVCAACWFAWPVIWSVGHWERMGHVLRCDAATMQRIPARCYLATIRHHRWTPSN